MKSNSETFYDVELNQEPGAGHVSKDSKERLSGATVAVALESK